MVEKTVLKNKNIVILAGGLNPDGSLPEQVIERIFKASSLYKPGDRILASSRYSLNLPQKICDLGYVISEAKQICAHSALAQIPSEQKFLEHSSTDTIGSALFVSSMLQNEKIFYDHSLVISSHWHLKRVRRIFNWAFDISTQLNKKNLRFFGTNSDETSEARRIHENNQLKIFEDTWLPINDVKAAFAKLFCDHDNYSYKYDSQSKFTPEDMY